MLAKQPNPEANDFIHHALESYHVLQAFQIRPDFPRSYFLLSLQTKINWGWGGVKGYKKKINF
jgi:hypothetical protein